MNEHECGSSSVETSRRKFLQSIGALTFAGATAGLLPALTRGQAPKSKQSPNVIIILSDDLGWGDLGCYGQTKIKTPVLDRMAAEGMRFTDAYAGSAVCAPPLHPPEGGPRCPTCTLLTNPRRIRVAGGPLRSSPSPS